MMKRGQGLPLNVIIVAIIVLVVLVVLIAIFTGRIAIFQRGVSEQAQTELIQMRIGYGACHPDASRERTFLNDLNDAQERGDVNEEAQVKARLQQDIDLCKATTECRLQTGCTAAPTT